MVDRPQSAYTGKSPYVFVSYSHRDQRIAYPEIRRFQEAGFDVWWDEGISPGAEWRAEITDALRDCALVVFLVTENSATSSQCIREVDFALDEYHRPVLLIYLEDTRLPDSLRLALSGTQAIVRPELSADEYESRTLEAIARFLEVPVPVFRTVESNRWFVPAGLAGVIGLMAGAAGYHLASAGGPAGNGLGTSCPEGQVALRIDKQPPEAQVSIANIEESFYQGMCLPSKRYEVSVSADTFLAQTRTIQLGLADRVEVFTLAPQASIRLAGLELTDTKYEGERLSLNFQDIEVRAILQLIADFAGINLVASDAVSGRVTLRLQNVPWDQALDLIVLSKGLSAELNGNTLLVTPAVSAP